MSPFRDEHKFRQVIASSKCFADVLRAYGRYRADRTGSGGYKEIHRYIRKYSIDTSHFLNRSQLVLERGHKLIPNTGFRLENILAGKHPGYSSSKLKRRLIEAGIKEDRCEECGSGNTWNDKPLTLQLDHKNGDPSDHQLENLQILCPNCHSQTPTYGSKVRSDG